MIFQEREAARKIYKIKSADKAKKKQKGVNTFVPGGELAKQQQQAPRMTKKDADAIKVRSFFLSKMTTKKIFRKLFWKRNQ